MPTLEQEPSPTAYPKPYQISGVIPQMSYEYDHDWDADIESEDEELADFGHASTKDAILFAIEVSESMLRVPEPAKPGKRRPDETSLLHRTLRLVLEAEKRKIISGPNDYVGIMLYNTKESKSDKTGLAVKPHIYSLQSLEQVNAYAIRDLKRIVEKADEDPEYLRELFPPYQDQNGNGIAIGELYLSCSSFIRAGAPSTGTKRIFHVTDNDNPHAGAPPAWFTAAQTNAQELFSSSVKIEPFFIAPPGGKFDTSIFYSKILPTEQPRYDDEDIGDAPQVEEGFAKFENLAEQLRIREQPKRVYFASTLELADDFVIGVKGYNLIVEQKTPSYVYVAPADKGKAMREAKVKTTAIDEETGEMLEKKDIVKGFQFGGAETAKSRIVYNDEEMLSFRSLGLPAGLKLLGFKDPHTLNFEDNIGHSTFLYPSESTYTGSTRVFASLLRACLEKNKIGYVRATFRRHASPRFCAMIPQEEQVDEEDGSQLLPPGFHLIPLPFADDVRSLPIEHTEKCTEDQSDAAAAWMKRLRKKTGYEPDAYPNPSLALFFKNIEAIAFEGELDMDDWEDATQPKVPQMMKYAGEGIKKWKELLGEEDIVDEPKAAPKKRKRDSKTPPEVDEGAFRSKWKSGKLASFKKPELQDFCHKFSLKMTGNKSDLIENINAYFEGEE